MNTQTLISKLNRAGLNNYRIRKETGISYETLRKWRDGEVKRPSLTIYMQLNELLESKEK